MFFRGQHLPYQLERNAMAEAAARAARVWLVTTDLFERVYYSGVARLIGAGVGSRPKT
jgi:hypothetical protein